MCQPFVGDCMPGCVRRLNSGDGRQEVVAFQRVQLGVDDRRDRRRPRHVSEQRDLAEVVALGAAACAAPPRRCRARRRRRCRSGRRRRRRGSRARRQAPRAERGSLPCAPSPRRRAARTSARVRSAPTRAPGRPIGRSRRAGGRSRASAAAGSSRRRRTRPRLRCCRRAAGAAIEPRATPPIASPQRTPEDAGQELVRDDPLEQGEHGDVLDAVGGADDREQDERRREVGPGGDERDRQPPEHEREAEGDGKPAPSERHRSERSDQAADADRGSHVADRSGACVEELGMRRRRSGRSGSRGRRSARRSGR